MWIREQLALHLLLFFLAIRGFLPVLRAPQVREVSYAKEHESCYPVPGCASLHSFFCWNPLADFLACAGAPFQLSGLMQRPSYSSEILMGRPTSSTRRSPLFSTFQIDRRRMKMLEPTASLFFPPGFKKT